MTVTRSRKILCYEYSEFITEEDQLFDYNLLLDEFGFLKAQKRIIKPKERRTKDYNKADKL